MISPILELQRQRAMLQLEYEAERAEFQRQTATMGLGRKVKRGDCWWPLQVGRSYYNSLNQLVVEVTRSEDTDIEHNFEYGRQVAFFRVDGADNITYFKVGGTVSYAQE